MATAGDSGVSGTAADTATLSPEQLHKHLLAWGIPAPRVDRRSRQLADLGVTIQGLAVQPLNMLQVLLAEGGQATKADMFDAGVIKDGATKAAGERNVAGRGEGRLHEETVAGHRQGASVAGERAGCRPRAGQGVVQAPAGRTGAAEREGEHLAQATRRSMSWGLEGSVWSWRRFGHNNMYVWIRAQARQKRCWVHGRG